MKVDKRFKDTEFIIEADDFARQALWERYSGEALEPTTRNTIKWDQDGMGWMDTIGHVNKMPVCVTFVWAKLNGHLVVFYHACSRMVDHEMVDDYMKKYCNPTWDGGTRRAHCDASNFHHVLDHIRDCEAAELLQKVKEAMEDEKLASILLSKYHREFPYRNEKEVEKLAKKLKLELPKRK